MPTTPKLKLLFLSFSPSSSEVCRLAWNDAEVFKLAFDDTEVTVPKGPDSPGPGTTPRAI
jgi:hypothetical protein